MNVPTVATATLEVKYSPQGFDALVVPTKDGVFWLTGKSGGLNRATHRAGETISVYYTPDDQFATEFDGWCCGNCGAPGSPRECGYCGE